MSSSFSSAESLQQAIAQAQAGDFATAERACAAILQSEPANPGALTLAGALAAQRGDLAGAIASYRAALAAEPGFVKALSNLAIALQATGAQAEAEDCLRRALAVDADHGPSLVNLGQLLLRQRRNEEAIALLERATRTMPSDPIVWTNLGAAYLQAERHEAALEPLRRALDLQAGLPAALNNLGNAYVRLGRHREAVDAFRALLDADPRSPEGWSHLGVGLRGLGLVEEALMAQERALALNPGLSQARFHRALVLLGAGRFAEGWADYRDRPSARAFRARQGQRETPMLPASLQGMRILLQSNQGFGDELFFLRYAPELKRRGATVVYRAGAKLADMARQFGCLDEVILEGASDPASEFQLLVDDLPYALAVATPLPTLALAPEDAPLAAVRRRLAAAGPGPYLGVTWRAGVERAGSLFKAAPRAALADALKAWPGTVVVLQRQPAAGELDAFARELGKPAADFTADNEDLRAMLAVLAALDDYVAVSNTNVHLRAAAGRPTRVLMPMPPDWRWMTEGRESPWFPGSPIYRQAADGRWDVAFGALRADLESVLKPATP